MEEIKIAFIELQTETEAAEFLLYNKKLFFKRALKKLFYRLQIKNRIKKAVDRTVCIERSFAGEAYPVLVLPFSNRELQKFSSAETAELLNRLSDCIDTVYFFYQPQLSAAVSDELLNFYWVNEHAVAYIQKQELLPLCSQRLNLRLGELKVLLIESYQSMRDGRHGKSVPERNPADVAEYSDKILIVKAILRKLYQQTNSLSVLTEQQEHFQELAEQIYDDCGLVVGFVRQMPAEVHLLIDVSREERLPYHQLPKSCAYLFFFTDTEKKRILAAKRKDIIQI